MKLNLACGSAPLPGHLNIDILPFPGVTTMDLLKFPWDLPDASFEEVRCHHFVEHIPHHLGRPKDAFFEFFEEVHRIARPGALVVIRTPSPRSPTNLSDPTHARVLVPENFRALEPGNPCNYGTTARFRLVQWRRIWCPPHSFGYHLERYLGVRLKVAPYEREYVLRRL